VALLLAHAAVSLFCLGAVWFVQVVHYPLFAAVGTAQWGAYHEAHRVRTGWVLAGPMLAQLGLGLLVVVVRPAGVDAALAAGALALTVAVFAVTFLAAVPDHDRLGRGWDPAVGRRLVRVNAVRTALWTAQGALAVALVAAAA
jgi:hypothetical protein